MATERKKLKKDLKIFSSKTNDQILKKLHKKHQWDKGNKRYETEFWFHHYSGCHDNRKKKTWKKYLKIFSSKTTDQILTKLHQKHQCIMGNKRYRTEFWFHHYSGCHGNRKKKTEKKILKNLLLQNYWPDSYETSSEASVWYGEQTIRNGILISSLFLLPWQPKENKLKNT